MTLRPEVLAPTPPYVRRLLLGSVMVVLGVIAMAAGYHARAEARILVVAGDQ